MQPIPELKDSRILVTGASRGIGRATALMAGQCQAHVAVGYRVQRSQARLVAREIAGMGSKAVAIQGDVSKYEDCVRMVEQTTKHLGGIDVLINNAGTISWKPFAKEEMDKLVEVIEVNLTGMVQMIHAVLPVMKKQDLGGVIVNVASGAGKVAYPNLAVYSATKFGVLGLTQALGEELYPDRVRVYAISPGTTATDMTERQGMPPEKVAQRMLEVAAEICDLRPGEDMDIGG